MYPVGYPNIYLTLVVNCGHILQTVISCLHYHDCSFIQNWLFRASDMAKFQTEEIDISCFLKTGNRASNKQTDYW